MTMLYHVIICVILVGSTIKGKPPPLRPPKELLDAYTLNNRIPIEYYYVDDTSDGQSVHIRFSYEQIEELVTEVKSLRDEVMTTPIPSPPSHVHSSVWLTQLRDIWLLHALNDYTINGTSVVIFGSTTPFYEAIALEHRATNISVIEYSSLDYDYPKISTFHVSDVGSLYGKFDIGFSISSFDHDGLGRYGDPLNPNGDIIAMETACKLLKPNGRLYLSVPIGPDVLIWNLHRRYGRVRLPLLLGEWELLSVYGMDEELMVKDAPLPTQYEPIFVLQRNTSTCSDRC